MSTPKIPTTLNLNKTNYERLHEQAKLLNVSKTKLVELALDKLFKNKKELKILIQ